MQVKIVFLVMSAVSSPQTVDQLARALAPHTVLVHHDFSQSPRFALAAGNVVFVPEPRRTGWACFGFVEGIFHSLAYALSTLRFDYLQLLSPTCLPIKPMAQFEAHLGAGASAHFDAIDLLADRDALMSVGYRAFTPEHSWRHRLARRGVSAYFGEAAGRRDEAGVWLHSGGGRGPLANSFAAMMWALSRPAIGRHIFDHALRPYYGSAWFGARRELLPGLVEAFAQPQLRGYFSRLRIPEEFLFPTLLMQLAPTRGPMNHVVKRFVGAHTGSFEPSDLPLLRSSPRFFARKFADDPAAPLRLRVLSELAAVPV